MGAPNSEQALFLLFLLGANYVSYLSGKESVGTLHGTGHISSLECARQRDTLHLKGHLTLIDTRRLSFAEPNLHHTDNCKKNQPKERG